ncbi:MAG: imidazolonepropionase [Gammaproteobacteria bacterium]
MPAWDALWTNIHLVTMSQGQYAVVKNAAIAVKKDVIAWVGPSQQLPKDINVNDHYEMDGQWITPGFIDCHTHLVYAGKRSAEFEQRLQGLTYQQIAAQGGGIQATVTATRAASKEQLFAQSEPRLMQLLREGVTTVEIKSGYGLDLETELNLLRVARELAINLPVEVYTTYLGAHAVAPEYKQQPDAYIDFVCQHVLPAVMTEKLADAVDVFCETIGFSLAQTEQVLQAAQHYGLPIKMHAEQLSASGAARLAARYQALSVDHLEYADETTLRAIAQSGTVAVLLPGAFYFLNETQLPPVKLMRELNIPMAVATDCNPGSSPFCSLLLMLNMACTLFKLTPSEALAGVTCHAARALGLHDRGVLVPGKRADFVIWNIEHPTQLVYEYGINPCHQVVQAGRVAAG